MNDLNLTPTTELEAVNVLLASIGESPVNSLDSAGSVDVALARQAVHTTSRRVQQKGWHWNTDDELTLARQYPSGEIVLPSNTLKVDTTGPDYCLDGVQRGNRLYDRKRRSFVFDKSVCVRIVSMLPFDELPEAARQYITYSAAREFQEGRISSETLSKFVSRLQTQSWTDLLEAEAENADYNALSQHYEPGGVLDR